MGGVVLLVALLPWGGGTWLAAVPLAGRNQWQADEILMQQADPASWDRMVKLYRPCPPDSAADLCAAAIAVELAAKAGKGNGARARAIGVAGGWNRDAIFLAPVCVGSSRRSMFPSTAPWLRPRPVRTDGQQTLRSDSAGLPAAFTCALSRGPAGALHPLNRSVARQICYTTFAETGVVDGHVEAGWSGGWKIAQNRKVQDSPIGCGIGAPTGAQGQTQKEEISSAKSCHRKAAPAPPPPACGRPRLLRCQVRKDVARISRAKPSHSFCVPPPRRQHHFAEEPAVDFLAELGQGVPAHAAGTERIENHVAQTPEEPIALPSGSAATCAGDHGTLLCTSAPCVVVDLPLPVTRSATATTCRGSASRLKVSPAGTVRTLAQCRARGPSPAVTGQGTPQDRRSSRRAPAPPAQPGTN